MKPFRLTTSLLILACCFFATAASAQRNQAKTPPQQQAKAKTCQSNQLSFPCPKGLQVKSDAQSGVFVAYSPAEKFGVFAFAPDKALSDGNFIGGALKSAVQNLYSTKLDDYLWKDSQDFTGDSAFSRYEVSKTAKVGFNKNRGHVLHLQYVRLSYKGKDIIAGFVYEMEGGSRAEKTFNEWYGGGSGEAADALQELVIKITGEKKATEAPGGPPPLAMPKSN